MKSFYECILVEFTGGSQTIFYRRYLNIDSVKAFYRQEVHFGEPDGYDVPDDWIPDGIHTCLRIYLSDDNITSKALCLPITDVEENLEFCKALFAKCNDKDNSLAEVLQDAQTNDSKESSAEDADVTW